MNGQQANSSVGGLSLVALMMPYMTTISATDSSYATTQLQYIGEQMPDLRFIYYAGGTVSRFSSFVLDPTQDLFPLSVGTNAATAGGPVVMRIKKSKSSNSILYKDWLNNCLHLQFRVRLSILDVAPTGIRPPGARTNWPNMPVQVSSISIACLPTISLAPAVDVT